MELKEFCEKMDYAESFMLSFLECENFVTRKKNSYVSRVPEITIENGKIQISEKAEKDIIALLLS
jgi:hypothetical protein